MVATRIFIFRANVQRKKKIPVIELQFMKSQRDKIGCKSEKQMRSVEKKEATRQKRCQERKQNKSKRVRIGSEQASVLLSHEIQLE